MAANGIDVEKLSVDELLGLYSQIIKSLKNRKVIRTKNFVGEIGEYLAIRYYNSTPNLPNLQAAPVGTENIDAISRAGKRYSIKTVSGKTTGVFYGLEPQGSATKDEQKFEYVIICVLNDEWELDRIYELDWDTFLKHKHWHSRMSAWNLSLSKGLIADAELIYSRN